MIPHFVSQINQNKDITITDPNMTRFMMTLNDAVKLVLFAFKNGNNGDIFVQKSPSTTIELADTLKQIYKSNVDIKTIGIRHAEKMHETLFQEGKIASEELENYFRICRNRDLNYEKYFSQGKGVKNIYEEYNSYNLKD